MRVFNVRLAAILLAIVVVFGAGVFFLHGFQVKRNAKFFLSEADKAKARAAEAKDKDPKAEREANKDAIDFLKWYVRLMPKDMDAMEDLGLMLADNSDVTGDPQTFRLALNALEIVVRSDSERSKARRRLVKMNMQMRRFQDAKQYLRAYLLVESPNDPDLLEQLGECQAETGETKLALESFQKAISAKPSQLTAYVQLAELLRFRLQRPQDADEKMEKLVRVNPNSYQAHLLRGTYLNDPRVRQSDEAMSEALEALRLAPENADSLILVAGCSMAKKDDKKARDCVTRGIKLHPQNSTMYRILADLELHARNRDEAIAVCERGAKATNRDPNILLKLANLLIDADRLKEANALVEELRKMAGHVGNPQAAAALRAHSELLRARIELAQKQWLAACRRFESVRGSMTPRPDLVKQIDFWMSQCYGRLGEIDAQERSLRRACIDPPYPPAKLALAELLSRIGKTEPGNDLGSFAAPGSIDRARLIFLKTLRLPPAQRDWQPFENALAEAEKATPDSVHIPLLRASMLVEQGHNADAEKLLLEVRDRNPKQVEFWAMLVALADRKEDDIKAERLLEESRKALGDTVEQRAIEAQHLVRRRPKDSAERLRKLAENADQFPEAPRIGLWSNLVNTAIQLGDMEQAALFAKKIKEKQPTNVQVLYLLLEAAIVANDPAKIEKALDDIKIVADEGPFWLYGRSVLLYLQSRDSKDPAPMLKQALEYLSRAREARKDWAKLPLTEARINDRLGRTDLALKGYREALDLGERTPSVIARTVEILYGMRQFAEADRLFRRLDQQRASLPTALLQLRAVGLWQMGDSDRAVETARNAVSADSKDPTEHLWLGRILGTIGTQAKEKGKDREADDLFSDAEKAFRRAIELDAKNPEIRTSFVQFLNAVGASAKAEAAIQDIAKNLAAKDVPFTEAQCYDALNKIDEAQKKYEAAQSAAPQDIVVARTLANFYHRAGKLSLAEALLEKILDGKVEAKESDIILARRELASILISRRNYASFKKAKSLIEQNLASTKASPFDRSLLGKLKASDPSQSERNEAVAIFKSLIAENAATPDDVLALVRMLMAAGNWPEASELLRDLVASNDKDPRLLAGYIDALLQHNEISSAEMYCERLEKLAPGWLGTGSLRADLLCAGNEPQKAFSLLNGFVGRSDAVPRDRGVRLRMVAEKLDQLGRQLTKPDQASVARQFAAQAESLYRTFAKENPGRELVLAVFLGTHDKVDEALDILVKSSQTANAGEFAKACMYVVEGGKSSKEQKQRLDKIIQSAMKKSDQPDLLLAMAELRTHQEQFAEAVEIYHKALSKAPDDIMALNNLAVLQALQGVKLEESLKLVDHAIEVAGPMGAMLDSRAIVYMAMGNAEKALEDIKVAVADQETPVRLFHLAQAHSLAGDAGGSRKAFANALRKGLTKEMLQPLEFPAFEKLQRLQK